MAELDLNTIWITWTCPECKYVVRQSMYEVGFGMDMDLTVNDEGCVTTWMESNCNRCGTFVERKLNKDEEDSSL